MYSQVGGSLGTKTKLGPWAKRHSYASVKGVFDKFLTQLPLIVLVLVVTDVVVVTTISYEIVQVPLFYSFTCSYGCSCTCICVAIFTMYTMLRV